MRQQQNDVIADAAKNNWVDTYMPVVARPWLRLIRADRPIGTWLLLLPCWQGIALAAMQDGWRYSDLWLIIGCAIGAFLMRGAGCLFNDIADIDIDKKVARTAMRPLASGAISLRGAFIYLAVLCLLSLAILVSFNKTAIILGFLAIIPVAIYPFMKRFTYWPQFFLGIAFNWGALLGYAAHAGKVELPAILLYFGGICWTIGYDTIYAHQDREDDALIGVKSTALLFANNTKKWLILFYGLAVIFAFSALVQTNAITNTLVAMLTLLGIAAYAMHLIWQIKQLDIDNGKMCLRLFRSNTQTGFILLLVIIMIGLI